MAAAGVATATAIAQYVSAGLILIHLLRRKDECRVSLKRHQISQTRTPLSILMHWYPGRNPECNFRNCQSVCTDRCQFFRYCTWFPEVLRLPTLTRLIYNVMYAFYTGCSSFMSQNYGARNKKRVLKSYFISLFYSFTIRLDPWSSALYFWSSVHVSVRHRRSGY